MPKAASSRYTEAWALVVYRVGCGDLEARNFSAGVHSFCSFASQL